MQTIKKPISFLLSLVMILSVFTIAPVRTGAETEGDWEYTAIPGQGASIVDYLGTAEDVVIPNMLGNETVTGFNGDPFFSKTIRSLTFPSTIQIIPVELMKDQTSLTEVIIPDGVEIIRARAFDGCTSLTEVTIPDSVTQFGDDCFPKSTTICCTEDSAAYTWFTQHGYNVRVLEHQHELSYVPASAPTKNSNGNTEYWYCSKCGKYFSDANGQNEITDLTKVLIPYFEFEYSNDSIDNGKRYYKLIGYNGNDEDITIPTVIPDYYPDESLRGKTVTVIRENAFENNTTIKTVTIPDSITHVGSYSFMGCSNLTEVTIGKGLDHFGLSSFDNCPELEKVTVYSKRSDFSMRNSAFANSDKATVYGYHGTKVEELITSYNIPFVSLGHAYGEPEWSWNDDLSSATASFTCYKDDDTQTVTATVTYEVTKEPTPDEAGERTYTATVTFEGETYTDEKTEEIPETNRLEHRVKTDPTADSNGWIEHWYRPSTGKYYADENGETEITDVTQVFIPYFTFEYIDNKYYKLTGYNGKDEDVVIPVKIPDYYPDENLRGKDFKIINENAFQNNTTIKTVTIPDTIGNIGGSAFKYCDNLTEIIIGTNLDHIGAYCFAHSPKLEKITIYSRDSEFSLHMDAFKLCGNNVTVYGYHDTKVEEEVKKQGVRFVGLEHTYDKPELSWSDDNSSATFKFTCVKGDVSETVDAVVTSEVTKAATCLAEGEIKYTATADFEGNTYIYDKIETLPKKHALQHKEKVYPTVEEHGNKEYWYCPDCGKYFKDENGEEEIPQEELNDYLVLPYFTFGEDDGYIKLISYNGNDDSVLVPDKIPANYPVEELQGVEFKIINKEAFKRNPTIRNVIMQDNIGYVDSVAFQDCPQLTEVTIGTGVTNLSDKCFGDCPALTKVTIYSVDTDFKMNGWAFDGSPNVTVYGYHDTEVEKQVRNRNIPFEPLEHIYGEPVWSWSDDYSSATATFTCTHDDDTQTVTATVSSEVTKEPSHDEAGERQYTATVTFKGQTYTDVKTEAIPKSHQLEHHEKVYPTVEEHGNKEYWYCPDCGKYFKDANGEQEIPQDELQDYLCVPYFTFGIDDGYIKLISYNGNDESVLVPDRVPYNYPDESLRAHDFKIIKEDAFKRNPTIRNVIIQDNVSHIGAEAFKGCPQLEEVTIGKNLDTLNYCTFGYCPSLKKVTIYSTKSPFSMHYDTFRGIGDTVVVYGYRNSGIESEANRIELRFVPLDPEEGDSEIQYVNYIAEKTWDIDFAEKDKPGSVQVVLQRKTGVFSWETLQIVKLDESNHWRTEFDAVPSGYEVDADNIQAYEYRIRELGPKKAEDDELDPSDDDFQDKVKERLIYDTWDYDRPVIKQLIKSASNPEVLWQFEPSIDWVKGLAKTTAISPPFVTFEIDGYNDTVKDVPKHTTKYMVTYAEDENEPDKTNITNLAVMDTAIYKRWINFKEGEKPGSVYLMLESKAKSEYAERFGLTETNFYTPSFDAVVGSLNYTDIPIDGVTLRGLVKDGISSTMGSGFTGYVTDSVVDAAINKYFASGLTVGKATPDSLNPLTRWRVKFTVKKYGTEQKLPMDFAGAELVTGIMEMVIDALIRQGGLDFSVPVMYEPFDKYWSIKGFALSLLHDYELTCNVINIKFHPGESDPYDGDPDDPDNPDQRPQALGGTKYWRGDNESDRPESIQLHVYYKDGETEKEVQGSPVTVKKGDSNGENGWVWSLKIPVGSPDRDKDYYIREDVPAGYAVTYLGLDLINSKSQTEEPTEEETEEPTEEQTEEPTQSQTEPPTEIATEPSTEAVTEPATEVMTEPPTQPQTQPPTQPHHDDDDDDDDDPDGPGVPIIPIPPVIPVPVVPVVPVPTPGPGPDTPDQPDTPTQPSDPDKPTETPEPTQPDQPTQATEPAQPTEPTEPADTLVVTKNWVGDTADNRPDNIKIHVCYLGVPIKDSPITLKKSDFGNSDIWISKPITLEQGVKRNALLYYEEFPEGYQYKDNYAPTVFGSIITNTWQRTNIIGTKTWVDGNNILGKRPDKITVNLKADGAKVDSTTVSASDYWQYRFTNKPIYKTENGSSVKINYTIEEEPVSSYTVSYDGYDITNTLTELPSIKGSYKFTHTDRYGVPRTKTVEVKLNEAEIIGYSGNNNQPGVPTYLWTAEARLLYDKNPLVKAALAVTGNDDDQHQQDVSVYKNDVEWDLVKTSADDATNMTAKSSDRTLEVFAVTKPYTFTFRYHFVKNGSAQQKGIRTKVEYGKPVTFDSVFSDPDQYVYIDDTIPEDGFCYWSADEAGLMPITTNRTFGMLMRGKWLDESDTDRVVDVYAQYENRLDQDWKPLIEESTFTHMISDEYDWVYLDYMVNYLSKDGKIVQDMVAEGDQNIRYGLVAVKHPESSDLGADTMIKITQAMIKNDLSSAYTDNEKQSVAYRFEYGKPTDTTKPISNFNRVLYTLRSDTSLAENKDFSVIAYITVDGENYYYSEVNNDINVHALLSE